MSKMITLYHGSTEGIEHPKLGKGKHNNDYGQGFYCTSHHELACELASKIQGIDGYINQCLITLSTYGANTSIARSRVFRFLLMRHNLSEAIQYLYRIRRSK